MKKYRPWGQANWVLDHSTLTDDIIFIGCLSTEIRCVEAAKLLNNKYPEDVNYEFLIIDDPILHNPDITNKKIDLSRESLESGGELRCNYKKFDLICAPFDIYDYFSDLSSKGGTIILDITCMPKRFFFIAVKVIIEAKIKNFMVTYSRPEKYCDNGELASNPDELDALPFFDGDLPKEKQENLVLSIGHSELGLIGALEETAPRLNLHVLFPFPPGPPSIEKNWRFMQGVKRLGFSNQPVDPIRVSATNVSDAFDYMVSITKSHPTLLAPYGPKPTSLAMCLFALKSNSKVVYTQPRSYNPYYSEGIGITESGKLAIYAYWINIDGENLYF